MAANIIIDPGKRNSARRKSRTLAVILGLLIASPGLAHADEPYWRQYRSIEDGFLIDAPALPRFESRVSSTPFGTATQHNYGAFPGPEGVVFMVSVMQKNAADRRSDADILAFSARAVPRDAQTDISESGVKGIAFGYDDNTGNKRLIRVFVDKGWTFIVQAAGPKAVFPQELAERWLQSWRPLPKDIPAGWREYKFPEDGFAISAPSRPAMMKDTADTAFGPVAARSYFFVPDAGGNDGVEFRISAIEKHAKDTRSEAERLDAAAHAANPPEDALGMIRQSGLTGYYYELTHEKMRYVNATFVHGDRRYTITTRVPDGGVSPEAKAWMTSWRLLEPGEK